LLHYLAFSKSSLIFAFRRPFVMAGRFFVK
jgi:hypothetical protein